MLTELRNDEQGNAVRLTLTAENEQDSRELAAGHKHFSGATEKAEPSIGRTIQPMPAPAQVGAPTINPALVPPVAATTTPQAGAPLVNPALTPPATEQNGNTQPPTEPKA